MAEVVNLNRARKARAKTEDKAEAARNRATHGRTKAERTQARAEAARRARELDGARREDPAADD